MKGPKIWAKNVGSFLWNWWGEMSGAISIPCAIVGAIIQGSTGLGLALAGFAGLMVYAIKAQVTVHQIKKESAAKLVLKDGEIDQLKAERDAEVDYTIELVPVDEGEKHVNIVNGEQRYCHHLQIRVLNRQHKLENCEPILKYIKTIPDPSRGQQPETIPVDSRLEFYQSEFEDGRKNISGTQKFDLGQTFHIMHPPTINPPSVWDGFRFAIDRKLGAKLEMLKKHCEQFRSWSKVEVGITLWAENVQTPKLVKFKIEIVPIRLMPGTPQQIEASIITAIP